MTGAERIAQERARRIEQEGFTAEHDAEHYVEDIIRAALCYAMTDEQRASHGYISTCWSEENPRLVSVPRGWPWDGRWWKPTTRERDLEKAGALFLAVADRARAFAEEIASEIDEIQEEPPHPRSRTTMKVHLIP